MPVSSFNVRGDLMSAHATDWMNGVTEFSNVSILVRAKRERNVARKQCSRAIIEFPDIFRVLASE